MSKLLRKEKVIVDIDTIPYMREVDRFILKCDCGRELLLLTNDNQCDCGRMFNMMGQELRCLGEWIPGPLDDI